MLYEVTLRNVPGQRKAERFKISCTRFAELGGFVRFYDERIPERNADPKEIDIAWYAVSDVASIQLRVG